MNHFNNREAYAQAVERLDKAITILQLIENNELMVDSPSNLINSLWVLQDLMMHTKAALECVKPNELISL